jgi:mannosyl-3-phosphoglycerate phosphatase
MEFLSERYRRDFGDILTVAIGDSALDVPLLSRADIPIAVQRPDGSYEKSLLKCAPKVRKAPGIGPAGWNSAVLDLLGT